MNDYTAREIAAAQELLGDLLAVGHTIEESAAFLAQLARGEVNEAEPRCSLVDGEVSLW